MGAVASIPSILFKLHVYLKTDFVILFAGKHSTDANKRRYWQFRPTETLPYIIAVADKINPTKTLPYIIAVADKIMK